MTGPMDMWQRVASNIAKEQTLHERALIAAREAVIAAARVWERNGREDRNAEGYTPEDEILEQAVYSLNRLEDTNGDR